MITSVLVANRGEIARRVFRTCRDLGIRTVAVHSDADADAPHVREADAAVRLAGNTPAETYLRGALLIDAALRCGADALHPGYGFLSENAGFARDVIDAGLTWIGPPPESIASMGSKIEAKAMMAAAGVPVLERVDPDAVTSDDLPLLIKASAGGGGRGMRIVSQLDALPAELELAAAEAEAAFGDATVFCEPYLATGRHIEVQVMADRHGRTWAVGERECSIQRRHQKIVEEAPSPLVQRVAGMRDELFAASRSAAEAIGYEGAGTVEFLADETGRFFFLEMNTRLQVEHPVTEATTGIDLVALQLQVAEGAELGPEPPPSAGHSIEVRLYAEDPAADWQPQSGVLHRFEVPGVTAEFREPDAPGGAGLRLDSGVTDGSVVGVHYDPMLAKVISWASDRDQAARRLAAALGRTKVHGVRTNRDLLVRILGHRAFLDGDTDTAFLDRHGLEVLAAPLADRGVTEVSALVAALALAARNRRDSAVLGAVPSGWRNVASQSQHKRFRPDRSAGAGEADPAEEIDVAYRFTRDGLRVEGRDDIEVRSSAPELVVLGIGGVQRRFDVALHDRVVYVDSPLGSVALERIDRFPDAAQQAAPGSLLAPMPGSIVRVAVSRGERVERGQPLLWLEAMKMQHEISAPTAGVVAELAITEGDQVDVGAVLVVVAEEST